jgi:cyclopropane fatty-acyl-phospholipid synthase-like methyltransferase
MMETTPGMPRFDDAYRSGTPPWVIGEPQPAVIGLERDGWLRGNVLDIGCGAGEHTILLTRLGYDVLGVDFAPNAIARARENATTRGVDARFEVADAMALDGRYDTVLDSALFHVFDDADRARYVDSLRGACPPGARVHVLALSDAGRGFGPEVSEAVIRAAFADGWQLEALDATTYRGVEDGRHVDEPAWLARARRI